MVRAGELKDIVNAPGSFPAGTVRQKRPKAAIPSYTTTEKTMKT